MRLPTAFLFIPLVLATGGCKKAVSPDPGKSAAAAAQEEGPATGPEVAADPASAASVVDRIAAAARDGDRGKLLQHWSAGALVDSLEQRGILVKPDAAARSRALAVVEEHFDQLTSYLSKVIGETHAQVATTATAEGEVVLVRTKQHDGSRETALRFWFRDRDGTRQLQDFEDITVGYRASALVAGLVADAGQPWLAPFHQLMAKVVQAGDESTFELAAVTGDEVDALLAADPPDDLRAFALKLKAECLFMEGEHDKALKTVKELNTIESRSPWSDFLEGIALAQLHRSFEAISAFNRFGKNAGWDSTTHDYLAWCHYMDGAEGPALEHARKGLELNKNATGCLTTAVLAIPPDNMAELAGAFKATFDPDETFKEILEELIDMESLPAARAVFQVLERELPKSKLVAVYREKLRADPE